MHRTQIKGKWSPHPYVARERAAIVT